MSSRIKFKKTWQISFLLGWAPSVPNKGESPGARDSRLTQDRKKANRKVRKAFSTGYLGCGRKLRMGLNTRNLIEVNPLCKFRLERYDSECQGVFSQFQPWGVEASITTIAFYRWVLAIWQARVEHANNHANPQFLIDKSA